MNVSYPAALNVCIWLGSFGSEDELDEAVDRDVAERLKLKVHLSRIAEHTFNDQSTDVRTLLEGFSGWRTFVEEAVATAERRSMPLLNSAFVCYHLQCTDAPEKWGAFTFLGFSRERPPCFRVA